MTTAAAPLEVPSLSFREIAPIWAPWRVPSRRTPKPRFTRPPLKTSSSATWAATSMGLRMGRINMLVPRRTRRVLAAR